MSSSKKRHDVRDTVLRLMEYSRLQADPNFQRLHMKCFLLFLSFFVDIVWDHPLTKGEAAFEGEEGEEGDTSLLDRVQHQADKLLHTLTQVHAPLMQEMLMQPICSELSTWLNSPIEMAMMQKNHKALVRYVEILASFCTSRRAVLDMEIIGLGCAHNVIEVMSLREMARRYSQVRQLERIVYHDPLLDAASALLLLHQVN